MNNKPNTVSEYVRLAETHDRAVDVIDGFAEALIGSTRNQHGQLVAAYDEDACIQILMNRLRMERPDIPENELRADAIDLLDDLESTFKYMDSPPIIIEGLDL